MWEERHRDTKPHGGNTRTTGAYQNTLNTPESHRLKPTVQTWTLSYKWNCLKSQIHIKYLIQQDGKMCYVRDERISGWEWISPNGKADINTTWMRMYANNSAPDWFQLLSLGQRNIFTRIYCRSCQGILANNKNMMKLLFKNVICTQIYN